MNDDELLKLALDIIAASEPSGIADISRWYAAKTKWLTEYLVRERPTWKFHGF